MADDFNIPTSPEDLILAAGKGQDETVDSIIDYSSNVMEGAALFGGEEAAGALLAGGAEMGLGAAAAGGATIGAAVLGAGAAGVGVGMLIENETGIGSASGDALYNISDAGDAQDALHHSEAAYLNPKPDGSGYVLPDYTARLEVACDTYNDRLEKLSSFILPGGTAGAALLHVARTVVRRAERAVWALIEDQPDTTSREPALYLNRLSDLLFILARVANPDGDVMWKPGGER